VLTRRTLLRGSGSGVLRLLSLQGASWMRGPLNVRVLDLNQSSPGGLRQWSDGVGGDHQLQESAMLKTLAAGATALFLVASPLAYAQASSDDVTDRLSAADLSAVTDARINIIKATLQLTPDQEKYWPPIEDAIRARAKDREARLASAAARVAEINNRSLSEVLRDRDPIAFMHRRAEALAQRFADLKNLADAWQPLSNSHPGAETANGLSSPSL